MGALEDEIRFYQRRTVEACLELGKRLLILRELSQIGTEFEQRVDLLGISRSTAYRFMQAAAKTAKSANLAVLSSQVKSASAFLELITQDDETLKGLAELDDVDRMSASELRAAVRNLKADAEANDKVLADKSAETDKLRRQLQKRKVAPFTDWPEAFKGYIDQVQKAGRDITNGLDALAVIRKDALNIEPQLPEEEEALTRAFVALSQELSAIFDKAVAKAEQERHEFEQTLEALAGSGDQQQG